MASMARQEIKILGQESSSKSPSLLPSELLMASIEGIILQTPPPLPIRGYPFRFLTKLDLTVVGLRVEDVPFDFGWKLEKFVGVEIDFEEFHIRDIGKNFGRKVGMTGLDLLLEGSGLDFLVEESRGEVGTGTGLEACFLETFESVTEALEASEEVTPEKSTREEIPKKGRVKTLAGRTDLPHARPFKRQRSQTPKTSEPKKTKSTTKSTEKPSVSPPPRSTRKSLRLALPMSAKKPRKGTSEKQVPEQVEDLVSSPDETPAVEPENTLQEQGSPLVPEETVAETENTPQEQGPSPVPEKLKSKSSAPKPAPSKPSSKPALKASPPKRTPKRKAASKQAISSDSEEESTPTPPTKKAKKSASDVMSPTVMKFLKRHVVRGKIFKVSYFQQQGLEVFLEKIRAQGWFELFTNTQLGCSVNELAEFYANCSIHKGVVVSRVGGKRIRFDAEKLGEILGVPSTGFGIYVREDKSVLGESRLLDLARRLSQETGLETPRPVKKGEMTPLHQLLYWFLLKNVIPRGQGRNQVDAMAQCLIDLMDREEQINLPALMIRHIERIANPSREHDLGYGFLLTLVFESFGVKLTKKVGVQFVDEIGSSTLVGCGYKLVEGAVQEQGLRTPCPPVPGSSPAGPSIEALAQAQAQLTSELTAVKAELDAERAETTKRYETLLALLSDLSAKLSMPPPAP